MSMSRNDYAVEAALEELHHEAVMKQATLAQCVYLFVEGESEETAFPILLEEAGLDLEGLGIVVANYNGIGNLRSALRLMSQTLSHSRPIVLSFDNDEEGARFLASPAVHDLDEDLVTLAPVPSFPVVKYPSGHKGGSFEEAFKLDYFIETCFHESFMDKDLVSRRDAFMIEFDPTLPWLAQVNKFCYKHGVSSFSSHKVDLAEALAEGVGQVPEPFVQLAEILQKVRENTPVIHPYDVELAKVRGLTC